jgi:lipid II:glycine glycyltransferase (peptidoglycan interpeptide bridge formation enzyme)
MIIREAAESDKSRWNDFVSANFPQVGAFLQSWEWGEFQLALGNQIKRLVLINADGEWQGLTLAIKNILPFGLSYYYLPRGPVLPRSVWEDDYKAAAALDLIRATLAGDASRCIFIRLEPALENPPQFMQGKSFILPRTYVQPRFNAVVGLEKAIEEIFANFSSEMRNSIRRAERNGVSVEIKTELSEAEWLEFRKMREETAARAGKNIYPPEKYFRELIKIFPLTIFAARHQGALAAINIVIFFSKTATHLFGAAYKEKLVFKVSSYLGWLAMLESKKRGFAYYDLGGIDQNLLPTLTHFKRQFGGNVIIYMGNADIPVKPALYRAYRFVYALLR